MDALGHVNNIVYFRYFESARIAFLQDLKVTLPGSDQDIGPILAFISCQFKAPLEFPDDVEIGTRVAEIKNTSMKIVHAVYSQRQKRIVAHADSIIVFVNYRTGEKILIPPQVKQQIWDVQGQD